MPGDLSSQFLTSLLMAAPVVDGDVRISIKDELISAPYVALTIGLMKKFGVRFLIDCRICQNNLTQKSVKMEN